MNGMRHKSQQTKKKNGLYHLHTLRCSSHVVIPSGIYLQTQRRSGIDLEEITFTAGFVH